MTVEVYSKNLGLLLYLVYFLNPRFYAEAVLAIFGFNRSLFGFDKKKVYHWWNEIYQLRDKEIESAKMEL
jgi:hypothetical protein